MAKKQNSIKFRIGMPVVEVYNKPGWQGKPTGEILAGNEIVDVTNVAGGDVWLEIGPERWINAQSGLFVHLLKAEGE